MVFCVTNHGPGGNNLYAISAPFGLLRPKTHPVRGLEQRAETERPFRRLQIAGLGLQNALIRHSPSRLFAEWMVISALM
jgi:hypothetical protein